MDLKNAQLKKSFFVHRKEFLDNQNQRTATQEIKHSFLPPVANNKKLKVNFESAKKTNKSFQEVKTEKKESTLENFSFKKEILQRLSHQPKLIVTNRQVKSIEKNIKRDNFGKNQSKDNTSTVLDLSTKIPGIFESQGSNVLSRKIKAPVVPFLLKSSKFKD